MPGFPMHLHTIHPMLHSILSCAILLLGGSLRGSSQIEAAYSAQLTSDLINLERMLTTLLDSLKSDGERRAELLIGD